ncbi:MAG: acyl-CoA dehydrogenase family protein [Pseudooceanicola atlanticus]
MAHVAQRDGEGSAIDNAHDVIRAARTYCDAARAAVSGLVMRDGRVDMSSLTREQRAGHGLAWIATTVEAMQHLAHWAETASDPLAEIVLQVGLGEYAHQLAGGVPISQSEIVRPTDLGIEAAADHFRNDRAVACLLRHGNTAAMRAKLADALAEGWMPFDGLHDETLDMIREQFWRFAQDRILPNAHEWHLADELIPDTIVTEMAELGVFGLCIPEEYGGLGLGKLAMCVVTEELSCAWIAAGSLGTRSEIAGELIASAGTEAQKSRWLPGIASGEILPTAVFTEPDTGSDLAHLKTRARRDDEGWRIDGSKTWITHASRSDLMTILARSNPEKGGHDGLSMFLAGKPRGTEGDAFPVSGLDGGEIPVLGYRGMKEYQLSFDNFRVDGAGLLGDVEGRGFAQLMQTFEGARIQTAARAVGVARRGVELGLAYAKERKQFGQPLLGFPRVADKLVMAVVELVLARELTYAAAREKDTGRRCDIEAGMAKLLAARVAWTNADAALQIHGGNGYALEFEISRVLCDARILNIFEGAAEIQAQVIARGLLAR